MQLYCISGSDSGRGGRAVVAVVVVRWRGVMCSLALSLWSSSLPLYVLVLGHFLGPRKMACVSRFLFLGPGLGLLESLRWVRAV